MEIPRPSSRRFEQSGVVVDRLSEVSLAEREALADGTRTLARHLEAVEGLACLRQIEVGGEGTPGDTLKRELRIVAWNVERLRNVEPIGDRLHELDPDVVLLSEVDMGMARSGNRRQIEELAARLRANYCFGVEFVELGLGSDEERTRAVAGSNLLGFHGNALLTRHQLSRPFLVRLGQEGLWYTADFGEPRVGNRMAIGGQVQLGGRGVTVVSVHLESHSDPDNRCQQARRLLDFLEDYDSTAPAVIGGDFNTSTVSRADRFWDLATWNEKLVQDPLRRLHVEPFEPIFRLFQDRGYSWEKANLLETPTERRKLPLDRPLGKVDWFFTRGLESRNPAVIPAVDRRGRIISDHDVISVEVR